MKRIILTLITLLPLFALGQSKLDDEIAKLQFNPEGKIFFQKIVESQLSKSELFKNTKKWIAVNYRDYKSVVKLEDEANGLIIFKGISIRPDNLSSKYSYTCEVNIKDNKTRIKIYDIFNLTYAGEDMPTSMEVITERKKARTDKKRDDSAASVTAEISLFQGLLDKLGAAIIVKDDF